MTSIMQDIRHALRQLKKSPGFTLTVALTLALGIGANTAIFTLIQQLLLRSLPVRSPEQLVTLGDATNSGIAGGIDIGPAAQALGLIGSGELAGRIVVVRQQHLLATSFHPELTGDGRVHQYFCDMVRGTGI